MKYYLYILINKSRTKSYVGITDNLARRLEEHNLGKSKYTKGKGPWEMLYTEELENRLAARAREKFFKSGAGRRKIKNEIWPRSSTG